MLIQSLKGNSPSAPLPVASLLVFLFSMSLAVTASGQDAPEKKALARGIVFEDVNGDGRFGDEDNALAEVGVSNGREIVVSDDNGRYELEVSEDCIVFVIKPGGFRTRLDENNLPLFYYIHKPAGSPRLQFAGVEPTGPLPRSIDFPLYRQDEPETFQAILFGDTQSRNLTEIEYMNRTTIAELVGSPAAMGVTLGDILFDDLSLYDVHNQSVAMIGIPWYNVPGNHDLNFDTTERRYSNETFERHFGPGYYSFNYGQVHFVVLDNINWHLPEGQTRPRYNGAFGEEQLEFLRNDLARLQEQQFVVLLMHIPLPDCVDARQLYRLIEKRPLCFSVSAHRHFHQHRFLDEGDGWLGAEPHHHIINVTVCGSWWSGRRDADGIPHSLMSDGAPHGYSIVTFNGDHYELDFRAAGLPADHQMHIMTPDVVAAADSGDAAFFVNVFNGSARSTVRWRMDGSDTWQELEPLASVDPEYLGRFLGEQLVQPPIEPKMARPGLSSHLWSGLLPAMQPGMHLLEVRTTDMHGREFQAHRLIRVTE